MILRVLWPAVTKSPDPDSPSLLLGAIITSQQQAKQVLTVAVISVCPAELLEPLARLQQQLSQTSVSLPTQPAVKASLAVVGLWRPSSSTQSYISNPAEQIASQYGLWLAVHGHSMALPQCLGNCQRQQQPAMAPTCDLQLSTLPHGTQSVQFCLYTVPAQQPGVNRVQLPLPQPAPQLPWIKKDPGAVSFSDAMHMLQEAHTAVQTLHARQQQPLQQHHHHQQRRRRARRQSRPQGRCQQAQQQAEHAPAALSSTQQGWAQFASLLAAADSRQPKAQHCYSMTARLVTALQGQALPHLPAAPPPPSPPAAGAPPAGIASDRAAASQVQDVCQSELLQVVVQQLLGLLIAINLLLHREMLLEALCAAAGWLQQDLLQPHIHWIMQAHPGGIKLHLELSLLLGTAAETCLQWAVSFYTWSWPWLGHAALLAQAAAAAVGGASRGCVAAADILLVLLWPLVVLFVLCAHVHRLQLRCLAATWRLIRGKQQVRRFSTHHRTQQQTGPRSSSSSPGSHPNASPATQSATAGVPATDQGGSSSLDPGDEVSVEQLIVGVLLFTPLLGLLPTTVAWYLSVAWLYGLLHGLRLLLVAVGSWMQLRPLHVLAARWSTPQLFPGQLMVLPFAPPAAGAAAVSTVPEQASHQAAAGMHRSTGRAASSSSRGAQVLQSTGEEGGTVPGPGVDVAVAYYHVFYEPLGYRDVLVQSTAQQQGLLWRVCQGVEGSTAAGGRASWVVAWLKDIVLGRPWGLRMMSTRWRLL